MHTVTLSFIAVKLLFGGKKGILPVKDTMQQIMGLCLMKIDWDGSAKSSSLRLLHVCSYLEIG